MQVLHDFLLKLKPIFSNLWLNILVIVIFSLLLFLLAKQENPAAFNLIRYLKAKGLVGNAKASRVIIVSCLCLLLLFFAFWGINLLIEPLTRELSRAFIIFLKGAIFVLAAFIIKVLWQKLLR
ncbi:MAG: hypothetical protein Q4P08_06775 [Eubacteriales bacterium]|nr:hypothetical protein [Eubacteriales bacterium]